MPTPYLHVLDGNYKRVDVQYNTLIQDTSGVKVRVIAGMNQQVTITEVMRWHDKQSMNRFV